MKKILVCGTRKKGYGLFVRTNLNELIGKEEFEIVEGCCPDSADAYAEEWAKENKVKVNHFPSTSGNYLKRNIEMVKVADEVLAFWDGFSYGTAHAIATSVSLGKYVRIILLK